MSSNVPDPLLSSSRRPATVGRRETSPFDHDQPRVTLGPSRIPRNPSLNGSPSQPKRHSAFLLGSLGRRSRIPTPRRPGTPKSEEIGLEKREGNYEASQKDYRLSNHGYSPSTGSSPLTSTATSVDGQSIPDGPASKIPRRSSSRIQQRSRNTSRHTDPATLINLALQLSQSRARTASARFSPHLAGAGTSGRVVSLGSPILTSPERRERINSNVQAPTDFHVSISVPPEETEIAPGTVIANGLGTQYIETAGPGLAPNLEAPGAVQFLPSPQTLIRAERARMALELRYHHRRVLKHLPKLPSPSNKGFKHPGAKGELANSGSDTQSDNGNVLLGRQYNPLQYARNRKTRYRERMNLDAELDGWKHLERVRTWVDNVAISSRYQVVTDVGKFGLPPFEEYDSAGFSDRKRQSFEAEDASPSKTRVALPPNDWVVHPWELFADAYWVQQNDNLTLMENHNGDKIYRRPGQTRSLKHDEKHGHRHARGKHAQSSSVASTFGSPPDSATNDAGPKDGGAMSVSQSLTGAFSKHGSPRKESVVKRLSKRLSKSRQSPSSSDNSDDDHPKKKRPWSGAFGTKWHGDNIPDRNSPEAHRRSAEDANGVRSSSEMSSARKISKESRRPFSLDLEPPREETEESEYNPNIHGRVASSNGYPDLDSNSTHSPANSALGIDVAAKRALGSPAKITNRNVQAADRHHEIQSKDFAKDPFVDENSKLHGGFTRAFHRKRTSTLSSPSETSFSAASDNPSRTSLQRTEHERHNLTPDRELGFHPLRPWKAGAGALGRARELLRRRDTASETSDTDDDTRKKGGRSDLSRATTSSSKRQRSSFDAPGAPNESLQYQALELPTFRSTRQTASPSRDHGTAAIPARQGNGARKDSAQTVKPTDFDNPAITVSSAMSRTATSNDLNDSSTPQSRPVSTRRGTNERRGAFTTDVAGNQWPTKHRTDAEPWPGQDRHGEWPSNVWTGPELRPVPHEEIGEAEVARLRAILMSNLVKASSINEYYESVPALPSSWLCEIRTFEPGHKAVARIEEPRVLASYLKAEIDVSSSSLDKELNAFTTVTLPSIGQRYQGVKDRVQDGLMEKALVAGDEADSLGARIAGECTLEVKELNDRIDLIWRARRRRSRWLRRIVFTLLEWTVLAVMWGLWFLVVCFRITTGSISNIIKIVKWLLWLS